MENNLKNWIWPPVDNIESAKQAARQGFWASLVIIGITIIFILLSLSGNKILDVDLWALTDAAIFALIAFGISRFSRSAAVAGLIVYLLEKIYIWISHGILGNIIIVIILTLAFVNSIRGTFAYHRLLKERGTGG
jgi:hypothetical protein